MHTDRHTQKQNSLKHKFWNYNILAKDHWDKNCSSKVTWNLKKKQTPKMPLSSFLFWHLLLDMFLVFKCGLYSQWDSTGENKFFLCEQISIRDSFFVRDGSLCPFPLSELGSHLGPVQALSLLPQSLWIHMCASPVENPASFRHVFFYHIV